MTVYMEVTRDRYELPLAVADTMTELAHLRGVTESAICHRLKDARKSKYVRVEIEEETP